MTSDEESRFRPDAGHWLVTARPDLEPRLNRKARQLRRLNVDTDAERVRLLTIEVTTLVFQVFVVVGDDVIGGRDDTFISISKEAVDSYDLSMGKPFSHYFRFLYGRRKRNAATRSEDFNAQASSLESHIENHGDDVKANGERDEWEGPALSDYALESLSREAAVALDDNAVEAEFARFLALVVSFLNHTPDKRDYTEDKKLYTRLLFTEAITRLVKTLTLLEECEPFNRHEHEVMSSIETQFQDEYMLEPCRSIRKIWLTDLKPEHKPIKPGDYSWKLSNGFILEYLEKAYGIKISSAAVSQQRANFRKFATRCGFQT